MTDKYKEIKLAWARGEVVQFLNQESGKWVDWGWENQIYLSDAEWRVKPKTITINGHDVPEPLRELENGQQYCIVDIAEREGISHVFYYADRQDLLWVSRGLCHATEEAAQLHLKALLSFTEAK